MRYDYLPVPDSTADSRLRDYLNEELHRIYVALLEGEQGRMTILHAEPTRPREGQVVYADGTDWNPGLGAGVYLFNGTSWLQLSGALRGTWTPALTFATPGNLAIAGYAKQVGRWTIEGAFITYEWNVDIAAGQMTHTTAAGALLISGLTHALVADADYYCHGACFYSGISRAAALPYSEASSSNIKLAYSPAGGVAADVVAADTPSGGALRIVGTLRGRLR